MRETTRSALQGPSPWLPVSYYENPFSVSLFASLSADNSGITYKVQHTPDNPQDLRQPQSITRTTTTATVTDPNHGLKTGDCLMTFGTGDPNLDTTIGLGTDVTVVDVNTYTYVVANTGAAAARIGTTRIVTLKVYDHAQMTGLVANADGNYAFPVQAVRVRNTAWTAGTTSLKVIQSAGR